MSIGPVLHEQSIKAPRFSKLTADFKKVLEKPLFYIFYLSLLGLLTALFFNHPLPLEYHVLVVILAGTQVYQYFIFHSSEIKKIWTDLLPKKS